MKLKAPVKAAILFIAFSLPSLADIPAQDDAATNIVLEEDSESFFTWRKIAGFGLLMCLFWWMAWNQKRHERKDEEVEEISHDEEKPSSTEEISSDDKNN